MFPSLPIPALHLYSSYTCPLYLLLALQLLSYLQHYTLYLFIILDHLASPIFAIEMALSSIQSSSSALVTRKYDVFVSFRGQDTRNNFTDHLFGALQRKCIMAFRDDTKLRKGESIAPELLRAIEGSHVFVVVFSKNYASSTWCLRELEKILQCVQVSRKRVLPIFYDVDPSEVRYQKGSYAEAFTKHEERFKQDLETVYRWRATLTQVASLSGWDVCHKPQYTEIEKIVEEIINILDYKFSSLPNDLVGIHYPIEELEKLLFLDSIDDVRVVGICGMGGLGKTTLATVLYGRISHHFDACCFIDDISKSYRHDGPTGVQKQILHQILCEEHLQICNPYNAANLIHSRLRRVRALIILDNVDQAEQLEKLAMKREWLGTGSRVIIISRDEHILKEYGIDGVYKVPLLNEANSLQLFCQKAFKRDSIMSNYEQFAYDILRYADGLPLAIKVLGSFLFGRDISEWRSALARLRESPNNDIMDVLRLSFDGLEEQEKEIFLHIACFFFYNDEKYVKNILNSCGFYPDIGLRVLIDKSLISIDYYNCCITMHYLLQELGTKIVQENSTKKPIKWSRLWLYKHFDNVMLENMEKNVEAIVLDVRFTKDTEILIGESLSKMSNLRLLILFGVNFPRAISCLSNKLRYVEWHKYPFKYLPSSFQPNQLVELILEHSNIKQLWKGKKSKYLPSLRTLDLSYSKNLIKTPDFGEVPNLERLNVKGCVKLVQLHPSIGLLRKLVYLNLEGCKNLKSIPSSIFGLSSLKDANLSGLSKAFKNAIRHLEMLETSVSESYSQSTSSTTLPFHSVSSRAHTDLLPSLPSLSCLCELDLSLCGLSQIPYAIGCLRWLERLILEGNKFVMLPSLKGLSKLWYLNLNHCKWLKSLPELPLPETASPTAMKLSPRDVVRDGGYKRTVGLHILNCPELGEWECYSRMTFSWMIQFVLANQQSFVPFPDIHIIAPGSEIPRWFNNQSVGSSIRIDPSPILHDNINIIGIAFCAVFCLEHGKDNKCIQPRLTFLYETSGNLLWKFCATEIDYAAITRHEDLTAAKSNHIWLIYISRKSFFRQISSDLLGVISVGIWFPSENNLEVKNVGYHWVYKQDLQLIHGGSSLARKRKFLEIEDEAHPQPKSFI